MMPQKKIGEKIAEGKNDGSVSTQNFLIIYIFLFRDMIHYPCPGWLKSTWMMIGDAVEKNW
jgi:hypothetical protein